MKFAIEFVSATTEEIKEVVVALSADECKSVAQVREQDGTAQADLIAACYAMRHGYAQMSPKDWEHRAPPQPIYLS